MSTTAGIPSTDRILTTPTAGSQKTLARARKAVNTTTEGIQQQQYCQQHNSNLQQQGFPYASISRNSMQQ